MGIIRRALLLASCLTAAATASAATIFPTALRSATDADFVKATQTIIAEGGYVDGEE